MSNEKCIICNSSTFKPYAKVLKQCVNCGHVNLDVNTSSISVKEFYNLEYYKGGAYYYNSDCLKGRAYFDYVKDRNCLERNFRNRLKTIRKYCPRGNLLEIGSAYGFFLNLARRYFSVTGYELCQEAVDYAREKFGLDVRSNDFLKDTLPGNSFDAVVMWDVIEHLPNPQDFIEKIYFILKKDGILAITTGDIGSFNARCQGKRWRMIQPPLHIHYFSKKTLTGLLNKYGFQVLNINHPGYWRSLQQILYNQFFLNESPRKSLFKLTNSAPVAGISIYSNLFDIMQVISKK